MIDRSSLIRQALSVFCIALFLTFSTGAPLAAQQPSSSVLQPLSPQQLDTLVAPIALYPDALLSQVLVASTYPLELVEAGQWLQQNQNLQGPQLVDAARQQNWDASIQALVVFPDVIERLNLDIRWATDLGNAFLAQQADVMNSVQRLRAEARSAGRLNSNTEETIATDTQGGQTAIEIQPANPNVMYVPTYNPEAIWGPPDYGYYPPLYYPDDSFGFGFGPGIYIGGFFGGLGWGGWGWGPNWFNCSIFENGFFFSHFGFHGFDGRWFGGRGTWEHNPEHRLGVAYPNQGIASRYGGNFGGRTSFAARGSAPSMSRLGGSGNASFGNRGNFNVGAGSRSAQFGSGSQPNYRSAIPNAGGTSYRSTPSYRSYGNDNSSIRSTPAYRSSPSFNSGSVRTMPAYRSSPSFNNGGVRTMPTYRSSGSAGGGSFHAAPSFGGGHSGGSSFHSGGGGGGFHGGGGGSHGGGGGSHGGGHR